LEEIVSKYSGTLLQQGYPQGPIFTFSRFFPFKVQPQEPVLGTIDYDHGEHWLKHIGLAEGVQYTLDWTKEFPTDGCLQITMEQGQWGCFVRKNKNGAVTPIGWNTSSEGNGSCYNIFVNKGDKILTYPHVTDEWGGNWWRK
jgi:hypothetical protein